MAADKSYIVIHCSDSPDGRDDTVKDIDKWHVERGFKRLTTRRDTFNPSIKACGYQYVIRRNGTLETGRAENEVGAHCKGFNSVSIGICLIGRKAFTPEQYTTLKTLLADLSGRYPSAKVVGHCKLDPVNKAHCPGKEAMEFLASTIQTA